jgi:hypothetical protein
LYRLDIVIFQYLLIYGALSHEGCESLALTMSSSAGEHAQHLRQLPTNTRPKQEAIVGSETETFEETARRENALRILESSELLMWHAISRNEVVSIMSLALLAISHGDVVLASD